MSGTPSVNFQIRNKCNSPLGLSSAGDTSVDYTWNVYSYFASLTLLATIPGQKVGYAHTYIHVDLIITYYY
jgi:hypothetical protein